MSKLIVLSGVPGSGKSYFSKTIKKVKSSHVYVISSDALRREIAGSQTCLDYDPLMWKIYYELAKVYSLDKEAVVILDATNAKVEFRVDKNLSLKPLFDETILVMWNIDKQVVSNQNLQREYPIAPEILDKYYEIFEAPSQKDKEFFDKIIIISNSDIAPAIEALELEVDLNIAE